MKNGKFTLIMLVLFGLLAVKKLVDTNDELQSNSLSNPQITLSVNH